MMSGIGCNGIYNSMKKLFWAWHSHLLLADLEYHDSINLKVIIARQFAQTLCHKAINLENDNNSRGGKMKSLWNDEAAAAYPGDLGQRVYTSRLLGQDKSLVMHGGGNTSVKLT